MRGISRLVFPIWSASASRTCDRSYRCSTSRPPTRSHKAYVRIELSRSWQLSGQPNNIIQVVALGYFLAGLDLQELLCAQICVLGEVELADSWRFVFGLKLLNVIQVGLLLGLQVDLLQRGRSVTLQESALNPVPRGLWIVAGESCDLIEGANLGPGGDLKLLLAGLILVIHPSPLEDLPFGVYLAMRSSVLPDAEGGVEGECLKLLSGLHQ